MIRKFKKQLSLLFAGSFTMVLAACYGMPVDVENDVTVETVTEMNEAIPGLKVTLINNGLRMLEDYTDENGNVFYPSLEQNQENDYKVKIEDIDGEENGGDFQTEIVDFEGNQSYYTVNMQKQ